MTAKCDDLPDAAPSGAVALGKYLALYGGVSRRAAVAAVRDGRVTVNGVTEENPARRIAAADKVFLDGAAVADGGGRKYYYMLNKPRGFLCSNSDPHGEKLAVDLLPVMPGVRLFSAGRLDKDSEGLIIFSNDGEYVERIAHPRYGICKRYLVELTRPISGEERESLCRGVVDEGETLHALAVESAGGRKVMITLNEGKKREIRRMTAAIGAPTVRLRRISLGGLSLGDLPVGSFRELTVEERQLSLLSEAAGRRHQ